MMQKNDAKKGLCTKTYIIVHSLFFINLENWTPESALENPASALNLLWDTRKNHFPL